MNGPSREELVKRREAMQRANFEKAQLALVRSLVDALDAATTPYTVLWSEPGRAAGDPLLQRWPMTSTQVLWAEVPAARFKATGGEAALRAALGDLASPTTPVTLLWSNGASPALILAARDAAVHAGPILDSGLEVWLCGPAGDWLIEYRHHDNQLAWAALT